MSSIYKEIFTDATKDVIGNDPVLDQFDISYAASLYGSTGDAYITGSLLSIDTQPGQKGVVSLTTGSRGNLFSKFYKAGNPSEFSSPWVSWYFVPWKERFSRTSRFIQCFDANERYYDSCLPDLNRALGIDGTRFWGIDPESPNFHSVLSPVSAYLTSSAGYVVFNSIKQDRSSDGFEVDPLVNNMWTWSYPFENKYNPERRYLKFSDTLGVDGTYLYCNWYLSANTYDWGLKFDNIRLYQPENFYKFDIIYPILPGKFRGSIQEDRLGTGYRNAIRGVFNSNKSYKVSIPNLFDSSLDSAIGLSFLLPSEGNLLERGDVSNLDPAKKLEYGISSTTELLTKPLNLDDSVRFYFGFGDLNNMTYASASITEKDSNLYAQDFERNAIGTYYFLSTPGSGLFSGYQEEYSDPEDRGLAVEPEQPWPHPSAAVTMTRTLTGMEPNLFIQFSPDTTASSYWQTKKGFPGNLPYTFNPGEDMVVTLNMQTTISNVKIRLVGNLTGSSGPTYIGYWDSVDDVPNTWGQVVVQIPGSDFSYNAIDSESRIVFDIQFTNTNTAGTVEMKTWHDYGGELVYSRLDTVIPVNPSDLMTITPRMIETYTSTDLTVNWENSSVGFGNWTIEYKDGDYTLPEGDSSYIGASSPSPAGIFWTNPDADDDYVLYVESGGEITAPPVSIDITSSLPWSVKYERGSLGSDMQVYFSGIPSIPASDDTTVQYELETYAMSEDDYDLMSEFKSINIDGGTSTNPTVFGPGAYKLCFALSDSFSTSKAALNNIEITTYSVTFDPFGPKIGGNNYPEFRYYAVKDVENCDITYSGYTPVQRLATKQFYQSHIMSFSPVIRGWKYGLVSGFPTNTRSIFRRDRYGQFRDMLEQRQYTKLVTVNDSPTDDDAIVKDGFNPIVNSRLSRTITMTQVNDSPVQVGFFKQRYKKDDRGIGYIYKERVSPDMTYSQNVSSEVTSSLPYFDGEAKMRQESSLGLIKDATITSLQFDPSGFTVI